MFYRGPINGPMRAVTLVLSGSLVLATIQNTITSTLVIQLKNDRIVVGDILGKVCTTVGILYCSYAKLGVVAIALVYLAGACVNFSSDLYFGLRDVRPSLRHLDVGYMRKILRLSLPIGLAGVLGTIYFRADGFLLSLFRSSGEVGLYGVAYKIVELTMTLPVVFMAAVFPLLAAARDTPGRVDALTQRAVSFLQTMAAPAVVGVAILAPELARLLGGTPFERAWKPLAILMFGNYFVFTSLPYNCALLISDRQAFLARVAALALVANVLLNLAAIPLFGVTGAAWSVVATEVLIQTLLKRSYRAMTGSRTSPPKQALTLVNAAAMGAVVFAVRHGLDRRVSTALLVAVCVGAGMVVYAALAVGTRTIAMNELRTLVKGERG